VDRAILDEATDRFGRSLAWALAALGLALIAAAWLQVRVGLSPLSRLREGIGALRRGGAEQVPGNYPSEVMPLVAEMNDLLASQAKSMEFARARAADLAHGLKTPLSVLTGVADRLRENGDAETAATIDELTGEMADRIDYQLRLSRLRMRSRAQHLSAPLDRAVERTVAVLKKTRDGERVDWRVEIAAGLVVDIDPHDLIELVGVLLENAAQWARATVHVRAAQAGDHAELVIADDGPGIGNARAETLGKRGQRLDEAKPGSGLGLAIAREIIALNDGTIALADAGGLTVTVRLPLTQAPTN
jgi:signal transduction histidine kinase